MAEIWKVCEVSKDGTLMTLQAYFQGSRRLPMGGWLMSEPFTRRLGSRDGVTMQGFYAYPNYLDCKAYFDSCHAGRRMVIVAGEARGITPHVDGTVLCHELKLVRVIHDRPAA